MKKPKARPRRHLWADEAVIEKTNDGHELVFDLDKERMQLVISSRELARMMGDVCSTRANEFWSQAEGETSGD